MLKVHIRCVFWVSTFLLFLNCSGISTSMPENNIQALNKLKEATRSNDFWVRVHAYEFLQQLGYHEWVDSSFYGLLDVYGNEPEKRIGVWRIGVRGGKTKKEKENYIDKIRDVYLNAKSPDRLHAAETLAKLGVSLKTFPPGLVSNDLESGGVLRGFVLWGNSLPADPGGEIDIQGLLELFPTEKKEVQEILAYGIMKMKAEIPQEVRLEMEGITADFSFSNLTRNRISLALTADNHQVMGDTGIKDHYRNMILSNVKSTRFEACEMMAYYGDKTLIPDLYRVLTGQNVLESGEGRSVLESMNLDCQSAAAFALLSIERKKDKHLSVWDWGVIAFFLLMMLGIGFYYSRRASSKEDYLLGGRTMNPFMVGLSLFATLLSTLSYLAYPGELIKYGPMVAFGILSFPVAYWIVGKFLIPEFMKLNVTSAYEVLELKLGHNVRNLGTVFFLLLRFLWMSTIIYATVTTALSTIMGFSEKWVPLICLIIALITVLYTTLGGIKAVVLTDAIQSFILLGGAILTIIIISSRFGNSMDWFPREWLSHWEELQWGIDFKQRMTIGNIFVMTLVWQVCTAGSDQMAIQRYLSTGSKREAKWSLKVSLMSNALVQLVLAVLGLAVLSYFVKFPEDLEFGTNVYENADALFPRFILVGLPVGISGLVVAGIMAAAMSSLSSGLNSSSSVLSEDVLDRHFPKLFKTVDPLKQVRLISVILGIVVSVCSMFIGYIEGNLLDVVIKVVNLVVAPLFVLFFMALFVPKATDKGTFFGGIFSLLVAILIAFTEIFGLSVLTIMPVSLIAGIVSSYLFSELDRQFL